MFGEQEVRVLQALHFLDSPTRNKISRLTGLSSVSVSSSLNQLIEAGAVLRVGKISSRSGRPSAIYSLSPEIGFALGIFFDASSIRIVSVDSSQQILCKVERPLILSSDPEDHFSEIINQVSDEARRFIKTNPLASRRLLGIGVAPLGMVDTQKGMWLNALRVSGITHVPLRDPFQKKFSVPVVVEDAARCIAWMERTRLGGSLTEPLVLLYLADGVGAGIVINESLYYGAKGLAGEIGHMMVAEDGDRCSCGNVGCLEMLVSEAAILRTFRRRLHEGVISSLQQYAQSGLTLARILEAGRADDRLAQSTLYDLGLILGDACAKLIELYNPRTLLVGGVVGVLSEFLKDPTYFRIKQQLIPEMLVDMSFDYVAYSRYDEAIGAAMIAERQYWERIDIATVRNLLETRIQRFDISAKEGETYENKQKIRRRQ